LLEDVQKRAQEIGPNDNQLLNTALSDWLIRTAAELKQLRRASPSDHSLGRHSPSSEISDS
jgi:hypothetical protein